MSEIALVLVDGPNADNIACAAGALNAFPDMEVLVAVSATAAHTDPNAPLGTRDIERSNEVQEIHTARMAGLMARAGRAGIVYSGLKIENTGITSVVPHNVHVRHEDYDIFGDAQGFGRGQIAGSFDDLLQRLSHRHETVHLIVGGPFSEVPHLIGNPEIAPRLGRLAAQAGFQLSERAIYSKLAFNVDTDMLAALKTLLWYPGQMINVPSDITRRPDVTFDGHQELLRYPIHQEIAQTFIKHRTAAEERHAAEQRRRKETGEQPLKEYPSLSIHDLQAVLALSYAMGREDQRLYSFATIDIEEAVANIIRASGIREDDGYRPTITPEVVTKLGYLEGNRTTRGEIPERLVVTDQDATLYKGRVPQLLGPLALA